MHLFALAFDHRASFARGVLGIDGRAATPAERELARTCKAIAYEGLLHAVGEGLPEGEPALLLDDEHGLDVVVRACADGVTVALAVEETGRAELAFARDPFYESLRLYDPPYAKVLVRYNPAGDLERNARQRQKLLALQSWLAENGKELMLELLVPPEPEHLAASDGDSHTYDIRHRPELTVRAIRELAECGLAPKLWKLEGMESADDYRAVADEVRAGGRADSGCVVLGRGAEADAVDRWLTLAASAPGFVGFAIGRTIWWDPLVTYVAGECSATEAAGAVARSYLGFVDVYLAACIDPQ